MFAQTNVSSKTTDTDSRGKEQISRGIPEFSMGALTTGEPLVKVEVSRRDTVGSGSRGGWPREYIKTGTMYLDKEGLLGVIQFAVENKFIAPEEVFSGDLQQILEAALRVERKRLKPRPIENAA